MGLFDSVRALFERQGGTVQGREIYWANELIPVIEGMSPEDLFRTQPYLNMVVSFVARNIAHLGLHVYERVSDTDRQRLTDDPLAQLLKYPNPTQTTYELINATVSDLKLHDSAYWMVIKSADAPSGWQIWQIPPSWVIRRKGGNAWAPDKYVIQHPRATTTTEVDAENMLVFHGWNPRDPSRGLSPVEALRGLLIEQISAQTYRTQVWQRGGRVGTYITRPAGAPAWDPKDKERFIRSFNSKLTSNQGSQAGGTALLGDGMELKRLGFSAKEDEWAEVAKLSLATVASVYHVNPTMVGLNDNSNYSNVREFRKMLYGDTLGPDIAMLEDRINTFLVPLVGGRPGAYVEFNIDEKLQGNFEEQSAAIQAAVGAPWRTRNEARAMYNLPSIEGGDELVTPLNVLTGGQASPQDSAPKSELDAAAYFLQSAMRGLSEGGKAAARLALTKDGEDPTEDPPPVDDNEDVDDQPEAEAIAEVLAKFFKRQQAAILSALGAKARRKDDPEDWWDAERWDGELTDDLYKAAVAVADQIGWRTAEALGFDRTEYDPEQTRAYLMEVAKGRAGLINADTLDQIKALMGLDDLDAAEAVRKVLKEAVEVRAPQGGRTITTALVGFSRSEAAKQLAGDKATKTWRVRSTNPRRSHARLDGETVAIDAKFSNGMLWPGDWKGGPDEVSGCHCTIVISTSD